MARTSMAELHNGLEMWLALSDSIPWSNFEPKCQAHVNIRRDTFIFSKNTEHDYWLFLHQENQKFDR